MLLRNKKQNDENQGKWIGVGGKLEQDETPEQCLLREVKEETGLTLRSYKARGEILFSSDEWGEEMMYLYTADAFTGELISCDEGELRWIPREEVMNLNLWEGDREFLALLSQDAPFFKMKLSYRGEQLVDVQTEFVGLVS